MPGRKNLVPAPKRPSNKRAKEPLLFGPAPLIEGEDGAAYDEFLARISGVVKPKDFLEEIWVRDVVDLSWEVPRMRRLKASLLSAFSKASEFSKDMEIIVTVERIDRMVMSAEARRNAALREIERHRAGIAEALRRATDDVVDADFEDVAHDEPNAESRGVRYEDDEEDAA